MSTRDKKVRAYAERLKEVHPEIYKDRVGPKGQWYSGDRLARKHAKLGLKLEK